MRILDYIFFCRPMLLIPVWTVFLLFHERILGASEFSHSTFHLLVALSSLVAGAYVINQIFDRESDRLNKKLGFLEAPIGIRLPRAWTLYLILALAALALGLTVRLSLAYCFVVIFVLGALYSAPPVRAKDRPVLGWLFNAVSYSIAIWWVILVYGEVELADFLGHSVEALAIFCAISATYVVTTIPDAVGDKVIGKRTIATELGADWTLMIAGLFSAGSLTFALLSTFWVLALSAVISLALVFLAIIRREDRIVLLAIKAPILALTVGAVISFPLYGLFLVALVLLTRVYYRKRWGMSYPSLQ